ncbi:MAG: hypothetical protein AAF702_37100 [Chloroflexota bacterium]
MSIHQGISEWDGKSTDKLHSVYEIYGQEPGFSAELIVLLTQESHQKGATWLLKKHFESGSEIEAAQVERVYESLPTFKHWETKLHILQCISYMPISHDGKNHVEAFLQECLTEKNKFVRAWAYNGFYELAVQHAEYQDEVGELLDKAMIDEAASVRARIRQIMKKGF